jgi:hypothetical protein
MTQYFNDAELQEEQDIRDQLESEQAHQQSMDEYQELMTIEEQKEYALWQLRANLESAIALCGKGQVIDDVVSFLSIDK